MTEVRPCHHLERGYLTVKAQRGEQGLETEVDFLKINAIGV